MTLPLHTLPRATPITAAQGAFDPRGPAAREIADLWWIMLALGTVVYAGFLIFLAAGLIRRRRDDSATEVDTLVPSKWIVLGGVVIPAVVLAVVFGLSLATSTALPGEVPEEAVVIEVVGHRWWWEIGYEGHDFSTANEIHIPVGEPVALRLTSADVIHSFWVPQLAGKIDALPDGVNQLIIEAEEPSRFGGRCAEFCGLQHANMGLAVIAEPRDQFEQWLERQEAQAMVPASGEPARGLEVFFDAGCADCHTIRGTGADGELGPDLTHLQGRDTLAATTLPNTREHLAEWVSGPQSIKEGVLMPDPSLGAGDLETLLALLETLR